MTINWQILDEELTRWNERGLTLPLWWRDDDAISATDQLHRLSALAERHGLPVHLAIIPKDADQTLVEALQGADMLIPVVHGWSHENHAPASEKKAEFGAHRPVDDMLSEIEFGLRHLAQMFGPKLRPMFVPPWNRLSGELVPWLAGIGFSAVSTFTPRKTARVAPGLWQINTHLDPVDWKNGKSLHAPQALIQQVATDLRNRRNGQADNEEPYGILTHHLIHDEAIWDFTDALIARLMAGPGHAWAFDERTL
ncbi:polysaccharide deacetylase family protein [Phaeobacter sp.]|uniref:polysaccharide deacetylase family protein n=1 Tax=Phaeobacter sp. TaxID=1902409 RepID=UPI0025CF14BB|nr:polysaccharide deacetylase family protein [Phaeobacter sp.]